MTGTNEPDADPALAANRAMLARLLERRAARPRSFPLSFTQQRLWFLHQMDPGSSAYNLTAALRVEGDLQEPVLAATLREIARRHKVLQTTFTVHDGEPVQVVSSHCMPALVQARLDGLPERARQLEAPSLALQFLGAPFDLSRGPLLRVALLRLTGAESLLLVAIHHIVADGWSLEILVRELSTLYAAFSAGRPSPLPQLPLQYVDFVVWQREWLRGDVLDTQLGYWQKRLQGAPVLELPTDRPRPAIRSSRGARHKVSLPPAVREAFAALAHGQGATLFMALLAAFSALLHRDSGQEDLCIGIPIAYRHRRELEGLIGFFANTLVVRTEPAGEAGFFQLLRQVRELALEAFSHQDVPFEKLVEILQPERDLSRTPLFQVAFALQGAAPPVLRLPGLTLSHVEFDQGTAKFDLSLELAESATGISGVLEYSRDLFDGSTVVRLSGCFERLLAGIVARPEAPIKDLPLLGDAERAQVLREWNDTESPCPQFPMVHELFSGHARRQPGTVAMMDPDGRRLTYGELEARSNRLAWHLRGMGVAPEVLVAICTERTLARAVGILGIVKAGGAYVSLDPAYPQERLAFLLEDAGASVVLTEAELAEDLPSTGARVIRLDADWESIQGEESSMPPSGVGPGNLAYVVYTSGSTGRPKGVEIPHAGLMNLVRWHQNRYGVRPGDRGTQVASPAFDASIWELWPYLSGGASLAIPDQETRLSAARMIRWWAEQGITLAYLMTPLAEGVLEEEIPASLDLKVRALIIGGDLLHRGPAPGVGFRLMNHYGPAEYTVTSTATEVPPRGEESGIPTVGRAIDNTRIYILDRQGQPVPVGVPGELYVTGIGLARGYHARPALTAEKFLPDPFAEEPGARMYRTADLVRWLPGGEIDFLGRLDHQVKIRGLRIELGEIEAVLQQHPGVREAVVLVREERGRDKRLAAYVVPGEGGLPSSEELKRFLRQRLPDPMVPRAFVHLEAIPLTANGKVDRRALPAPHWEAQQARTAPRTPLEQRIAAIWAELLGVERVGVDDNFFDLGGHSLLMVRLQHRLRETLGCELSLVELFQCPTVRLLAARLSPAAATITDPLATRFQQRRKQSGNRPSGIAVIGMAGRFPGARDVDEFWRNLCGGVESISRFGEEELIAAGTPPELMRHPRFVPALGYIEDADCFDAGFFGVNPREAEIMDPQHRIFLECCWQALEDAGYGAEEGRGSVGVFAGSNISFYLGNLLTDQKLVAALGRPAIIGNGKDHMPTFVSYKLNLKGPSVNVQTACSTSLVAVHMACQSLWSGECDMALAGGASLYVPLKGGYVYEEGDILSPDGHCRAFDAAAGGTVGGCGVGAVVLKPVDAALADGDAIYAVIQGTAINNDGSRKVGYTAPSVAGQAAAIAEAHELAGFHPETIGYIEAHGTGTRMGDPIEIAALDRVFRSATERTQFCAVGSVKTNVGHLDSAAGLAGLIKTVLAVHHGQLPPSLHFERPNPEIDFAASGFYVNTELRPWPGGMEPRRAGVSSFGIGGTNAHVALEQGPPAAAAGPSRPCHLLVVSARSESALGRLSTSLAEYLAHQGELDLADVAYTLQRGRQRFDHRRILVCRDLEGAIADLEAGRGRSTVERAAQRPVAFLFPGQGAQYVGMTEEIYHHEEVFRRAVDRCCELLDPHLGLDLRTVLYAPAQERDAAERRLRQTALTQPALFVVEYALARLWMSWGVRPWAMLGHSIGEYVAACLAGVFSLEDALALVAARGRMIQGLPAGEMLAVSLPQPEVERMLAEDLSLAAVNAPDLCVVSGASQAIDRLHQHLAAGGRECRRLHTSHAFHSAMMEPILKELEERVGRVERHPPEIPYLSNVTGTWIEAAQAMDPAYWSRHMRSTVRFADGVRHLFEEPEVLPLEVGPGNTLGQSMRRQGELRAALASLRGPKEAGSDVELLLHTLGRLWLYGAAVDWEGFHAGRRRRRVRLPAYPFERRRYWIEPASTPPGPAPEARKALEEWTYAPVWKQGRPLDLLPPAQVDGPWLLFVDRAGLGGELAQRLRRRGQTVVTVEPGAQFAQAAADAFYLDPRSSEHFGALLGLLEEQKRRPRVIVHLWTFGAPGAHAAADAAQDLGFYSLIHLAQALAGERGDGRETPRGDGSEPPPVELAVVSSGLHDITGGERLAPEKATVLGPVKVIPQELAFLRCRSLDFGELPGGTPPLAEQAEQVLAELGRLAEEDIVAYRGRHRWIRTFEPVRLAAPPERPARWTAQGVYLITGGLGGLGLSIARYLAQEARARLVLIGRSDFPPRERWPEVADHAEEEAMAQRVRRVLELEQLGAEVLVLRADVAKRDEMAWAIARARERFGRIHGVIHAAGVPGGGLIQLKTREAAARVLAPKVDGTLVLADLLRGEGLEVMVLFSSLNALFGGVGQVDYCAANAFLDAMAHHLTGSGVPTIAIDWDGWQEVGMAAAAVERTQQEDLMREELAYRIRPHEGTEVFGRILGSPLPQVAVSTRDPALRLEAFRSGGVDGYLQELARVRRSSPAHPRPPLDTPYAPPRDELEQDLVELWQELLGIEQVGVDDSFYELGGHSLLATRVTSRIRDRFGMEISLDRVLAYPTVAELAATIAEWQAEQLGEAALARLMQEIHSLAGGEAEGMAAAESVGAADGSEVLER